MSISYSDQLYERSNEYVSVRSDAIQAQSQSALLPDLSAGSLFSSFVSLAATLVPEISGDDTADHTLRDLQFKDLGIINHSLILLGYGSSFMVSGFSDHEKEDSLKRFVLKRTIPLAKKQNDAMFQNRIKAMMLELWTLAHDPVRKHENIVNILGLAWETDPFDMTRKWPIFLVERATRGTLLNLFQEGTLFTLSIRLNLILDVILGLEVLHLCGIIHGDVKLENVLVFENTDNILIDRPFIAKLADFGGSLFDVSALSCLPSGTQPWNAPEWRKQLNPKDLQLTDIYSLGFVIWRIFANGKHPFLACGQPVSQEIWLKEVEILKANDDDMQKYLVQISAFETEIERRLVKEIIIRTVRTDPAYRSIVEVKCLVQETIQYPRAPPDFGGLARYQYQLRDTFLPYSSQGRMDKLDPAIVLYISKELLRAAQASGRPEEFAEAKYGLAVLSINGAINYEQGSTLETGLKWLAEAADAGCDRAQAIFYRIYTTPGKPVPDSHADRTTFWLLNSASKGFFQPLEDVREHIGPEAIDDILRTLRFKYSGTGSQRYDDLLPRLESRPPWEISAVQIQNLDTNLAQMYKSKDQGYVHGGGGFRQGDNILHHAASCGLRKTVDYLIGKDSNNINCININGETPLLLACRSGHYFVTMQLLEADADPKIASHSGDTSLHWLLSFDGNHVQEICRYLVAKLDQNSLNAVASEWGYIYCGENKYIIGTPLMRAVARNRLDVVQALLEAGADPTFAVEGGSALSVAAQLHYPHMIKVLLSKLPPNSLRGGTVEQSTGRSLLMDAICSGSLEAPGTLFARMSRHGHRWRSRAHETLQLLVDLGAREYRHDSPGWPSDTALSFAASSAEMDVVEFLLEHGCKDNIDKPSKILKWSDDQYTPLMGSILSKNFPVFDLLVKNGANTKALAHGPVPYTLLYECAQSSNDRIEFAQALIDFGVQVDQRPEGYETPFACALRSRCFNLAKCLQENGANVNIEYSKGRFASNLEPLTVLGYLLTEHTIGSLSCLSFLLCHRPQLSAPDFVVSRSAGFSALHIIAIVSYQNQNDSDLSLILGCILDYFKPSPEQLSMRCCDKYEGNTALHLAALRSNYPIVRGLLSAGADPLIKNTEGFTALDLAYYAMQSFPNTFEFGCLKVQERTLKKAKERVDDIIKTIESACNDRQEYSQRIQSTNVGE